MASFADDARSSAQTAIAWVAGETSGDLLAAPVMQAVGQALSPVQAFGIGGPAMQAQGLQTLWTIDDLSVRGYTEVVAALPRLLAMRRALRQKIQARSPAAFVGVDAPDFNFRLEAQLKAGGIRTLHFIGPSVWAWRRERLKTIARAVDHMLLVFPFEKALYDRAGIPATYVGHPMADAINPATIDSVASRRALGLRPDKPVVALLPGSRGSEIAAMGDLFFETAAWMTARRPELQFVLPAANATLSARLQAKRDASKAGEASDITIVQGQAREALAASDTVLVASGTATLEAALMQRPMVITYRMSRVSFQIMRRMAYLPYVGLPNILCEDWVVPEYIQHAATPAALGDALLGQLDDAPARDAIVSRFAELHGQLAINCAQRAARVIVDHVAN